METEQVQSSEAKITSRMIDSMRSTKPWTRVMSILGFISVALMVLGGIGMIVAQIYMPQTKDATPIIFMGVIYIIMSFLYLPPAIYLFKYSSAIGRFLSCGGEAEMESALSYQKSFWKFVGILGLVMIAIAFLGLISAILMPLFMGIKS